MRYATKRIIMIGLKDRKVIEAAMIDWHTYTCVKFRAARPDDKNRITFKSEPGCSSHVGMKGGVQNLHLGIACRKVGTLYFSVEAKI